MKAESYPTTPRRPFDIDPALLDTPAAAQARAAGLLQMKRAAAKRAEQLAALARPLLVAVVAVSALHIFGQVARFAPSSAAAPALPAWAYHATAAALTLSIDLVALYLVAAGGALGLAGMKAPRRALGFFLGLTFALNLAYMAQHAPALDGRALAALLPWLDGLFVLLLPAFIPTAMYAVEGAAQALGAARLALLVEAAALAGLVKGQQVEPAQNLTKPDIVPAPAWPGPVLVAYNLATPSASWARSSSPPPATFTPAPVAPAQAAPSEGGTLPPADLLPATNSANTAAAAVYRCRHCEAEGLTKAEQLEHGRRHARERRAAAGA